MKEFDTTGLRPNGVIMHREKAYTGSFYDWILGLNVRLFIEDNHSRLFRRSHIYDSHKWPVCFTVYKPRAVTYMWTRPSSEFAWLDQWERQLRLYGHVARLRVEDPAHRILSCWDPRGWSMQKRLCQGETFMWDTGMAGLASAWPMARRRTECRRKVDAAKRFSGVCHHTWPYHYITVNSA